jgi:hypothetical protein
MNSDKLAFVASFRLMVSKKMVINLFKEVKKIYFCGIKV